MIPCILLYSINLDRNAGKTYEEDDDDEKKK